jgi:hypothetical protein
VHKVQIYPQEICPFALLFIQEEKSYLRQAFSEYLNRRYSFLYSLVLSASLEKKLVNIFPSFIFKKFKLFFD